MAAIKQIVGARTSLTVTGLGTLASGTYVVSNTYVAAGADPLDVIIEVEVATTNTPASSKQIAVFVKESLDGTNFRSGPESGTTTTDEQNLLRLGTIPMNSVTTTQRGTFSVAQALGYCPHSLKVVLKNEVGVALTSGAAYTSEISSTVA